jgi:glycosyltransferase involved in cell wall biosynthesis
MMRILHVIGSMDMGGAETFLMNLYRNIDRNKIQFDFVVHTKKHMFYENEILALGGNIYHAPEIKMGNFFEYRKWWKTFFREHPEYEIVHGNIGSTASVYLGIGKKNGKITIAHSHATSGKDLESFLFRIMTFSTRYIADYFFGCSLKAGIDRYGRKIVKSDRFKIVKNGIESGRYKYSIQKREKIRSDFNISPNTIVFGHVGRFEKVKNHEKVVMIFIEYHKKNPNSVLWLFGEGTEKNQIQEMVKEFKVDDCVFFMGISNHIWDYLQAMDLFLFPSYYEGLGIALIEAQASGLPCVVSDAIQDEADIKAGLITKVSLDEPIIKWITAIDKMLQLPRKNTEPFVKKTGFDIKDVAIEMQEFYIKIGVQHEK